MTRMVRRSSRRVTEAEREAIRQDHADGHSAKAIALRQNRSYSFVRGMLTAEFGRWASKMTEAQRAQAVEMAKRGMTQRVIAARFNVDQGTIHLLLRQRGVVRHSFSKWPVRLTEEYACLLRDAAAKAEVPPLDYLQGLVNDAVAALGGE